MKCAHLFLLVFVVFVFYKLYRFKIDFAVDKVANNVTQVLNNNLHVGTICRCSLLLNKNIAWRFVGKLEQVSSYETPLYQNVRNIKWKRKKKIPTFRPSTALSGLDKLYNDLMSECNRIKSFSKGTKIVSKLKGPHNCCIVHGSWGLAQCK